MKLPSEFYVVTRKSYKEDTINDILDKTDIKDLRFRFLGGLEAKEIIGIYTLRKEALPIAKKELKSKRLYRRK